MQTIVNILRTKAAIAVTLCLLLPLQAVEFADGTGEPNDPYQIATAEHLCSIGSDPHLLNKHFILIVDIDLDPNLPGGKVFDRAVVAPEPETSGSSDVFQWTAFSGVFDGNGHTISNLTVQGASHLGLFGHVSGRVKNVGVVDARITGSGYRVGCLAGSSSGIVIQCHSTGTVAGGGLVGGLVGENFGGVVGEKIDAWLGENVVGRMVRCHSDAAVAATGGSAGGLVGNVEGGSIAMSYSTGPVTGDSHIGGLIGRSYQGAVSQCYSTSAVSGGMHIGGLIGQNWTGYITHCYSVGPISGESTFGGLLGSNVDAGRSPGVIIGCFWDIEKSGQPTSIRGTGKTTARMQEIETFLAAGWDFVDEAANGTCDFWQMPAGEYPKLLYCAGDSPVMPEGSGTADEPYLIRDARDLGTVWFEPSAHYRLDASVDLSGITWFVAVVPWFEGTFDGNDHVIGNLHVQGSGYLGLFGQSAPDAVITGLRLEAADVNGTANRVGGLVGYHAGSIATSFCSGVITGDLRVGGLVGENDGDIETSHAAGVVNGVSTYAGGLVGYNRCGRIVRSYAAGTVDGGAHVGGLAGCNYDGSINTSYSTVAVSGTNSYIGGLVGYNSGSIAASHSRGTVDGGDYVGGLVGSNSGDVANSYSRGSVVGHGCVGGLVGSHEGTLAASYSAGAVTGGGRDVGGLVGVGESNDVTASFWDTETSGQATSFAGDGKTTAQMQAAGTFLDAGWDFVGETTNGEQDLWWILDGKDYPQLWWEL